MYYRFPMTSRKAHKHHPESLLFSHLVFLVLLKMTDINLNFMHRGQHIHSHHTLSLLNNMQSHEMIPFSSFAEPSGTLSLIPLHLAYSPRLNFGRRKIKQHSCRETPIGESMGKHTTCGELAVVGCSVLGADHGYHLGWMEKLQAKGRIRGKAEVCLSAHPQPEATLYHCNQEKLTPPQKLNCHTKT